LTVGDKQPDAEAIAALETYYGVDDSWKGSEREFIAGMRRALDAASAHRKAIFDAEAVAAFDETGPELLARLGDDASKWAAEFRATALRLNYSDMDEGWLIGWFANAIEHSECVRNSPRRAQSPSGLADDCAKIVEALRPFVAHATWIQTNINDYFDEMVCAGLPESPIFCGDFMRAIVALSLAESLPGRIEALEAERDEAKASKEMMKQVLGGSLYSARKALQDRAEAAGAQLSAREADVVSLRGLLSALVRASSRLSVAAQTTGASPVETKGYAPR
jgi:hypothetical protein